MVIHNKYPEGIIGKRFGKLTVIEEVGPYFHPRTGKKHGSRFKCLCDCGMEKIVNRVSLVKEGNNSSGMSRSCGGCSRVFEMRPVIEIMNNYKSNAKKANREFLLTVDEFGKILSQPCFYCGKEPSASPKRFVSRHRNFKYNGVDRVNNEKGYTIDNSLPCCFKCNRAKYKMSLDEFLSWIKDVHGRHCNYKYAVSGI